jgi:signal transduction histidine kinase
MASFWSYKMLYFRYRLLTVMVIGVITSALSLAALVRVLTGTVQQRRERVSDAVNQQLDRLITASQQGSRRSAAVAQVMGEPAAGSVVGMHAGYLPAGQPAETLPTELVPVAWRQALWLVREQCRAGKARAMVGEPVGTSLLVLAGETTAAGELAWAGVLLPPPHYWTFWRLIVVLLALATALLVSTAISAVVSFRRSAAALDRCLLSLAEDLSTPVPRPHVRELVDVADGIARLAERLAQARSEQQRLHEQLSQKERLAALGRVVAGVAHEVRNPLATNKLRLDLAAVDRSLPKEVELAIAHASSEIARLDRLVADLLVVAGRQLGPRARTAIGALLRSRVEALAPWATARGVTLSVQGDGIAVINAESVGRAIDNLLRNAVEAAPAGSVVEAEVSESATQCLIRVCDKGPGIARNAELFEPFFTTKSDGTGLGLPISRAIARAHGGDVTYKRLDESGAAPCTCFELSLARGNGSGNGRSEGA